MSHVPLSEIVRRAAAGQAALPRSLQATINVTSRCNSRCVYCSYGNPDYPHAPDPSFATLEALVRDLAQYGVRSLSLSGGEPFLRRDLADLIHAFDHAYRLPIARAVAWAFSAWREPMSTG